MYLGGIQVAVGTGWPGRSACRASLVSSVRRGLRLCRADVVQVGADSADADVELGGNLDVGAVLGGRGDRFSFQVRLASDLNPP